MTFNFHRILCLSASLAALNLGAGMVAVTAQAQTVVGRVVAVDIKAGDLNTALVQLSRTSGVQVVADPALLAGKTTRGVKGNVSVDQALSSLLSGQNLSYSLKGDTVIVKAGVTKATAQTVTPVMAAATVAQADTTAPEAIEEVVVTGFRSSLAKSLNEKRKAVNVIDVINAEDIGKFPSNNIAEALQRVPGISITRDRGEGLFVRVRGLGPNFQNVTIDGRSAAVNENVRDSGQSGRQFRFDTMASELVSGVEVIKSPLASLDEGAIGGTINIRTFKPLDFKKPTTSLSLTTTYVELADKVDPKASALVSWNNEDRTFGALVSANYGIRSLRSDRITGVGWTASKVDVTGDGIADTNFLPSAVRPTLERERRERWGLTAALQWRPTENTEIALTSFYTYLDNFYDELTYSADFVVSALQPGSARVENGVLVGGRTTTTNTQIGREIDYLTHDNMLTDLTIKHRLGEWDLSGSVYVARAYSNTDKPITRTRVQGNSGGLEFYIPQVGDGVPSLKFLTRDLNNPILPFRRTEWRVNNSTDEENAAQFDAKRDLSWGVLSQISGGVKFRDRSREYNRRDINFTRNKSGQTIGGNNTLFGREFYDGFPEDDFLSEASGTLPQTWLLPNRDAFLAILDTSAIANTAPARGDLRNSYYVAEKIKAGYVAANIDTTVFDRALRGEVGVRYAETDQTSQGHADTGSAAVPVSFDKTYKDTLPSANFVYELRDNVQVHVAAAKVITRPSLADLSPRLTLNSSGVQFTAVGGNPLLDPFEANQFDLTAEWYFAPGSALIGGVFYKDITTFVYNQNTTIAIDGQNYLLTAPVNGGEAWVKGFELAWQQNFKFLPAPFDGLGALANYTWTDSEATYSATLKDKMQNVAENSYNITVFYEKDKLGARLSYSWVDDVLASVGTGGLTNLNEKEYGSLDGNISYKIDDRYSIVAEAQNLTNEAQWQFAQNGQFGGYTYNGRTVSFGVRAKF
ncbi:TonB-dependent receptor [Asticcacaulis machinosus]|uniref:TonB-dependent receptor n=1 Tax=Asticcacaulis machinosus TaxID=2984211 RepID=A0ABT5HLY1_9CAUL|nr:TonB-dependent receptor [Asticcacaulis machinosus]MDC7677187.1 TonB-dependent receptor [Asticcacaulis machinosus]